MSAFQSYQESNHKKCCWIKVSRDGFRSNTCGSKTTEEVDVIGHKYYFCNAHKTKGEKEARQSVIHKIYNNNCHEKVQQFQKFLHHSLENLDNMIKKRSSVDQVFHVMKLLYSTILDNIPNYIKMVKDSLMVDILLTGMNRE